MKVLINSLAIALSALCLASSPARAVDLLHHGVANVPANRIVGLWTTQAAVRPCGTTLPLSPVRNTILFNAGGTVAANLESPITGLANLLGIPGLHERGPDVGTWSFNPLTQQYTLKLRFDWYVDGLYHGYSTVDRTILLSNDGKQASGPVRVNRYKADGSAIGALCGDTVSTRV